MIIETVSEFMFIDAFRKSDTYSNNFSYEGLKALYEYLENLSDDIEENINFDLVAICCDYTEFNTAYDAMYQYQPEDMPIVGEEGDDLVEISEKTEKACMEWLEYRTQVINCENGHIIIQNF